jgi:two-component system response regulator PilR (NtrC family)
MNERPILVVDDNHDLARGVGMLMSQLSSDVVVVHSAEEALALLDQRSFDVVFSDVRMPGMDGIGLLGRLRERSPHTRVILFTGFATVEAAVAAMKLGAFHYLQKPSDNDQILQVARHALKELDDIDEIGRLRQELAGTRSFQGIYGRDRRMLAVFNAIQRAAPTPASVLIEGESGTGKELVARAIHAESERSKGPFIAFNAAAVPESLAEAELFGSRKGAYTGADRDRKGLLAAASGGTFFIDEIASMPLPLQGKLLRALQEREVTPVGATEPVPVDVRIVASTNVEHQRLLRDGTLRRDLYYRLAVVRIVVPPLRQRIEDLALLCNLFLGRVAPKGTEPKRLTAAAQRLLFSYDWPGNVRELQNVIERAALMSTGDEIGPSEIVLESDDLDWQLDEEDELAYEEAKRRVLERFQRRYVEHAMAQTNQNVAAAARRAGITRAALHRIIKRLEIDVPDDPPSGR